MFKRKLLKFLSVVGVVSLLAVCVASITASAEFSGGSGTKKDPYLIKTADDLYNMRNNLSAYYKLSATIDMSGYKTDSKYFKNGFVPIGDDSTKPFTGGFICDLGSDGLPLYAILNLNVYNAKGELFNHDWYGESDYPDALGQQPPYYYQTALFGNTEGASIYNIYVLNATIYSSVVGQHDGRYTEGESKISYAAFIDDMSTAVLIGHAVDTTVSHCAVSGTVNGKSSQHGGLIGRSDGSNISDSYADVNIDTGGCWHIGNFIGAAFGSTTINNCYSAGTLNASLDGYGKMPTFGASAGLGAGGFVGTVDGGSTIQNSSSSTNLTSKTKGNNFVGVMADSASQIMNCFTYGVLEGKTSAPSEKTNKNNCYISTATNGLQADFNAASIDEINSYFLSQTGWVAGATYPVLSSVNIVTDNSIFVAGAEREGVKVVAVEEPKTDNATDNATSDTAEGDPEGTSSEDNADGKVINETITENSGEELGTVEIALISVLTIMIIISCALIIAIVYNTLRIKPAYTNAEEADDLTEYTEGTITDAE